MTPIELNEMIKRLRNGEKVECPKCKKGIFVTSGDYKTSPGFHCDYCKVRLNIN